MKKELLLVLSLLIHCHLINAQVFTVNNIHYNVIDTDKVEITDYLGIDIIIDIPNTVDNNNITYQVTKISTGAFYQNALTSVRIPSSVTSIESGAFSSNLITSLFIENGVTSIGSDAFSNNLLTTVNLPSSLISIGDAAFANNFLINITIPNNVIDIGKNAFISNALESVSLGSKVESIGESAFINNFIVSVNSLSINPVKLSPNTFDNNFNINLTIPENTLDSYINQDWIGFASVNGVESELETFVVDKMEYKVINLTKRYVRIEKYSGNDSDLVIPNEVVYDEDIYTITEIGAYTFKEKNLTSVVFPDKLNVIGYDSFSYNNLTDISIPNEVYTIDSYAFKGNNLTNIYLSDKITYIGNEAFSENLLTSIVIPNSVQIIANAAFYNNNIASVTIGDSVELIGSYAFHSNQLTSVVIPDNVITISNLAFYDNKINDLSIGNSVEVIGVSAFNSNNLTSVILPESIKVIDYLAFNNNPITEVVSEGINPPEYNDLFTNISDINLTIPENTFYAYHHLYWQGFKSISEGDEVVDTTKYQIPGLLLSTNSGTITSNLSEYISLSIYNTRGQQVENHDLYGVYIVIATNSLGNSVLSKMYVE